MKKKTAATLLLTASFALPFAIADHHEGAEKSMSHGSSHMGSGSIERISQDELKEMVTANSLMGTAVYDSQGDKIGDITDITLASTDLASLKKQSKKSSYSSDKKMDSKSSKSSDSASSSQDSSSTYSKQASNATGSGYSAEATDPLAAGGSTSASSSSSSSQSDWDKAKKSAGDTADKAGSKMKEGADYVAGSMSSSSSGSGSVSVIIAVGGVLGFGESLVSVPASSLSYNSSEDRYELSETKDQVVAIAEDKESNSNKAAMASKDSKSAKESREYKSKSSSSSDSVSSAASTDLDMDATEVRTALYTDSTLGTEGSNVSVSKQDDKIVLKGTVSSKEMKKQAEKVAKEATSLDIKNEIEVEK